MFTRLLQYYNTYVAYIYFSHTRAKRTGITCHTNTRPVQNIAKIWNLPLEINKSTVLPINWHSYRYAVKNAGYSRPIKWVSSSSGINAYWLSSIKAWNNGYRVWIWSRRCFASWWERKYLIRRWLGSRRGCSGASTKSKSLTAAITDRQIFVA